MKKNIILKCKVCNIKLKRFGVILRIGMLATMDKTKYVIEYRICLQQSIRYIKDVYLFLYVAG